MPKTTADAARLGLVLAVIGFVGQSLFHIEALGEWSLLFPDYMPWREALARLLTLAGAGGMLWAFWVASASPRVPWRVYLARLSWPIRSLYLLLALIVLESCGWASLALITALQTTIDPAPYFNRFLTGCFTAACLLSGLICARYRFGWGQPAADR
jgi:hypothetical protein